jgi:NAD(P)-dependent dehydrogenase (short-subunit alcohol dehydrogenase family)
VEQLEGKVAVVTGAASGIGLAMAQAFAGEGMAVVMADIEAPALEEAAASMPPGAEVTTTVADVSSYEQVEAVRTHALGSFGAVHVVCNNAGVGGGGPMAEIDLDTWSWILGVNLWGVIHGVKAFLPGLLEQGEGHIVNTASVAGLYSAPFMGPYNVSKFGVVTLSETMAVELSSSGAPVGVSVVCPSWVRTNIATSVRNRPGAELDDEGTAALKEIVEHFLTTGIEPHDVARQVVEAVRSGTFWVLTHPETPDAVRARTASILDGTPPPMLMH